MLHATLLWNETEKHRPSAQRPASPSCRHVCRSSKAQGHAFPYTLSTPGKRCVSRRQAQQPDSTVASGRSRTEPRPSHHLCARRSHARGRGSSSDTVSFVLSPVTAAAKATGLGRGGRAPTGHFSPHGRAQSQALSGVTPPRAGIPGDLGGRAALFARHPLLPASSVASRWARSERVVSEPDSWKRAAPSAPGDLPVRVRRAAPRQPQWGRGAPRSGRNTPALVFKGTAAREPCVFWS